MSCSSFAVQLRGGVRSAAFLCGEVGTLILVLLVRGRACTLPWCHSVMVTCRGGCGSSSSSSRACGGGGGVGNSSGGGAADVGGGGGGARREEEGMESRLRLVAAMCERGRCRLGEYRGLRGSACRGGRGRLWLVAALYKRKMLLRRAQGNVRGW